ncbi:MAG: alpha-mannosidase, partial [Actinomycetes bacterium]
MTIEAIDEAFDAPRFEDAVRAPRRLVEPGSAWGRPWHTTWFRLTHTVDERHAGRRLVASVDIGFNGRYDGFQAEAIAWIDGRIVHAIQPDRRTIDLGERAIGEVIEIWVE